MIGTGSALLLLAAAAADSASASRIQFAQLIIRERVIVRIPARPAPIVPASVRWREKKAPKCLPMNGVAGAAFLKPDSVDLIFKGGQRIRAELESTCAGLDYYSGFYILPTEDARICAGRDTIRIRSGGECQIARFRMLVPDR